MWAGLTPPHTEWPDGSINTELLVAFIWVQNNLRF